MNNSAFWWGALLGMVLQIGITWYKNRKNKTPEHKGIQDVGSFPNPMWVMFVPVLSTRHIREVDDKTLSGIADNDRIYAMPTGFLIYTGDENKQSWKHLPYDVRRLCDWASGHGYHWLRLDSDGDIVPEFPRYFW